MSTVVILMRNILVKITIPFSAVWTISMRVYIVIKDIHLTGPYKVKPTFKI